jgi:hypothetical protein
MGSAHYPGRVASLLSLLIRYQFRISAPASIPNLAFAFSTANTSVRGLVDQIVITDTGSTDNTIAVARECGATAPLASGQITTPTHATSPWLR